MDNNEKYKVNGTNKHPVRVPLHKQRSLVVADRPGYKRYIMNDTPGRREKFELAGWTAVEDHKANYCDADLNKGKHLGSELRLTVNSDIRAACNTAIVMEIPEELYQEDYKDQQAVINSKESAVNPANQSVNGSTYGALTKEENI